MKITFPISCLLIVLLCLCNIQLRAQIITSAQTGLWNSTTTWVGAVVPGAGASVIIANGHTVTLDVSANPASVTINAGGILTQNTNGISLGSASYVTTLTLNGTLTIGSNCITFPCMKVTGLTVGSGGIFTNNAGNAAAIDVVNFTISNNGTYNHSAVGSVTNGAIADFPGSTSRSLSANSNVNITRWATDLAAPPVALPTTNWGNLTLNISNNYPNSQSWKQNGALNTINGNLTLTNVGMGSYFTTSNEFIFNTEVAASTVNIQGDFTLGLPTGNVINLAKGGANNASVITFNVNGNFSFTNGWINLGNIATITNMNFKGDFSSVGGQFSRSNSGSSRLTFIKTSGTQNYTDDGFAFSSPIRIVCGNSVTTNTVQMVSTMTILSSLRVTPNCTLAAGANNIITGDSLTVSANGTLTTSGTMSISGPVVVTGVLTSSGDISLNGTLTSMLGGVINYSTGIIKLKSIPHNVDVFGTLNLGNGTITMSSGFNGGAFNVKATGVCDLSTGLVNVGQGTTTTIVVTNGAILKIGSPNGITTVGVMSGNIQFPGTGLRTFNTGVNYVYDGVANQVTGSGLPLTVNTFGVTNTGAGGSNAVTLTGASLTITSTTNSLVLNNGIFSPGVAAVINIPDGGTVVGTSGNMSTTSSGGTISFIGTGTVSATGTLNFYNVKLPDAVSLKSVDFGATGTPTIYGTLEIDLNRSVVSHAPSYAVGSVLKYNSTGNYARGLEWSTTSGAGYPYTLQVSNSTTLDVGSTAPGVLHQIAGNLIVDLGSVFSLDFGANNMTQPGIINGNVSLTGSIILSSLSGGDLKVRGNWLNSTGTFQTTGRTSFFDGTTGVQTISGTQTTFNNLVINNSFGVTMLQNVIVGNTLALTSGALNLNSNSLTINNSAAAAISRTTGYIVSEQTTNSSKVIWNIGSTTGAHTYPFGNAAGTYLPFILDLTVGDIGNATVSTYGTGTDNTPYPTTPVAVTNMNNYAGTDNGPNTVDRFWQIDKDGASGTATLTFSASSTEVGTITSLVAQRWSSLTSGWQIPLTGQISMSTSVTVPDVTTFSPWALSGNATLLPIGLVSFTATLNDTHVDLFWETASETNCDYFTVEKSVDALHYETVATVHGAGNSSQAIQYAILDPHPYSGLSYYRLRQMDFDSSVFTAPLVRIQMNHEGQVTLITNPVTEGSVLIRLQNFSEETISIDIIDLHGNVFYVNRNVSVNNEQSYLRIDNLDSWTNGIYLVHILTSSGVINKKLVIN